MSEPIRKEKLIRELPVALTDEEVMDAANELAEACEKITSIQERLAEEKSEWSETKKNYDSQIRSKQQECDRRSRLITTREDTGDVECLAEFDYDNGRVTVRRLDTDEVIEERDITELERQMELEFEESEGSEPETESTDTDTEEEPEDDYEEGSICDTCQGSGKDPDDGRRKCPTCEGEGAV